MGWRNIESFTTLVHIALVDGNGLGPSWAQVLKCLSEFQRLHMIGTGAKTDAQLLSEPSPQERPFHALHRVSASLYLATSAGIRRSVRARRRIGGSLRYR